MKKKYKVGQGIKWTGKDFLSDGHIKKIISSHGIQIYIIKLDRKAPNEYAWNTDEVLSFGGDFEIAEENNNG